MTLTCLALATAPQEMSKTDFDSAKNQLVKAREALEQVFSLLRTMGDLGAAQSHERQVVRGAWVKARFADEVLRNTEIALGGIERTAPRLRELTALTTSEVATQVNRVSHDLSELPAALQTLKPNANLLIGSEVFSTPKRTEDDSEKSPNADPASPSGGAATSCAKPAADKPSVESTSASASAASAPAASASQAKPQGQPTKPVNSPAAATAASAVASAAAAALDWRTRQLDALQKALTALSAPLGASLSLLHRLDTARSDKHLPQACGAASTLRLVPDERDVVLQAGGSFQFLVSGDDGRPSAQLLRQLPAPDALDLSIPLGQATPAVRLSAGRAVKAQVDTVVRISDSKNQQHFDIAVRICPGS